MKLVFLLLKNDLRRRLRNPLGVILMMCIPLVITLIIGLVFGGEGGIELPRIKVLLVDKDNGLFGQFIRQSMQQEQFAEMIDLVAVEEEEGLVLMEKGKASALIIIPENFTGNVLDRKPVEIALIKNPAEGFLPMIVEELVTTTALLLDQGMYIFAEPVEKARSIIDASKWPSGGDFQALLDSGRDRIILVGGYLTDSLVALRSEVADSDEEEEEGFNIFAFILPGSLMIGLLFISELVLRDIVREKNAGTLARQFAAPVNAEHVIASKILATFTITGAACMLLLVIGRFGFGISLGKPIPLVVQFIGTILMCTGVISLLYGFIRSERAADAVLSVAIIVMALFGGSMVPIEQMGGALQKIGRFSPVYWAADGFKKIFVYDAGLREISLHIIILYGLGIVAIVLGAPLLRRKVRLGG